MDDEPVWRARLRWRWRGALLWPAFLGLTLFDAILLGWLPVAGDGPTGFVPGLLLAGTLNLVAVAAFGRLGGRLVRRRRPDMPRVVADDYAGAALVVAVTAVLVGFGLAHRVEVREAQRDLAAQAASASRYIAHRAPQPFRRNATRLDTLKLQDDLYRTCVPGDDPDRWLCLFVSTDQRPPGVRLDGNREPNATFRGPLGVR